MEDVRFQLILTTCPDSTLADTIANALVEEGLAACVNLLPPIQSIYQWGGQVESATEVLLIAKARAENYPVVEKRIRELHPYELPEVIAVPIVDGLPAYLTWLANPNAAP